MANFGVDRYLNSYPLYLINFGGGQSVLYAYATIPFIKLLGANIISYRLPELLFYLMGILVCYLLVKKMKNKKVALLYSFFIITCPWNIEASRKGLDCNLLAPMFMLDLFLLLNAKKNWHYIIAGISIGVTLYTYCLSWILIPVFLITYISYMLYIKKIKFSQIVILGIPIFIFAIPLFYLLLLNNGYVTQTNFGIFTIPKLPIFRVEEIGISNLTSEFLTSLCTIFSTGVFYSMEIPLFAVGFAIGIKRLAKSIKTREFNFDGFITLIFIALLLTNMLVSIGTNNRGNILYLPMLYIITMGTLYLCRGSYVNTMVIILTVIILFINYEVIYFTKLKEQGLSIYDDGDIMSITQELENMPNTSEVEKYIITPKVQAYIYTLLENKTSPYEFDQTKNADNKGYIINSYGTYHFAIDSNFIDEFTKTYKDKEYVFVVHNSYESFQTFLSQFNFSAESKGEYSIIKEQD